MAVRTVTMSCTVKIEQKKELDRYAKRQKRPASEIVREALDDWFLKQKVTA